PLARAVDGCPSTQFFINGREQAPLQPAFDIDQELWNLRALPLCKPSELSASSTAPSVEHPGTDDLTLQLEFRNRLKSTACALDGFPHLQLLTGSGKPLPTRVSWYAGPPSPVLLLPGAPATIPIYWSGANTRCGAQPATAIKVRLPNTSTPITVAV